MRKTTFIILGSIVSFIISFQRTTPTVLYDELADYVNQDDTKMGIYGSMYYFGSFISFVLIGFFGTKLHLSYILSILFVIGGLGSLILSFTKSFLLLCISRFIIGLGLGPAVMVIVLIYRLSHDSRTAFISQNSLFLFDMLGALFTVGPFSSITVLHGWRAMLEIFAGITIILSVVFFFLAPKVSILDTITSNQNLSEFDMSSRTSSVMTVFKNYIFSLLWYVFTISGTLNLSTMWCGPFLMNFYLFSGIEAGYVQMTLFIGAMIGSLFFAFTYDKVKNSSLLRKIVHVISNIGLIITAISFMFLESSSNYIVIILLLFILGFFGIGPVSIMFSIVSNSYSSRFHFLYSLSNGILYLITAVLQLISSVTINSISKEKIDIEPKAFRLNFWIPLIIENIIAFISALYINLTDSVYYIISDGLN